MEWEVVAYALGVLSSTSILLWMRKLDRFLFDHWGRYKAREKRAALELKETRRKVTQRRAEIQARGIIIWSSDLSNGSCVLCSARVIREWLNADGHCMDCERLLSLRSDREIAIHTAMLQARAINHLCNVLGSIHEHEMKRDTRPEIR